MPLERRPRLPFPNRTCSPLARIVTKFGGTSVADIERIRNAAAHIAREVRAGHEVAAVVSAMAGQTNQLVAWTREAGRPSGERAGAISLHDAREYDAVVASGEQVTAGLLAIVLQSMGVPSRSYQGWQVPIHTDGSHGAARITKIEGGDLVARMAKGEVPVVTGFQGLGPRGRITTLGRGGSDTSAVALAAALQADRCDIYTDVDGVYTTDPRIVPKARRIPRISYEEMLEMASLGAKVLQTRSVEMAMNHHVRTLVRSSFADPSVDAPIESVGTLVCSEDEIMEQEVVTGITYSKDEAKVTLRRVADRPGVAASIFVPLSEAGLVVDMIVQNISEDGATTDMTFTVPTSDYDRAMEVLEARKDAIGYARIEGDKGVVKVSIIGIGMRSHAGVAAKMFRALSERSINIKAVTTSEIKTSVLIDAEYAELAVRALHSVYGLDDA